MSTTHLLYILRVQVRFDAQNGDYTWSNNQIKVIFVLIFDRVGGWVEENEGENR